MIFFKDKNTNLGLVCIALVVQAKKYKANAIVLGVDIVKYLLMPLPHVELYLTKIIISKNSIVVKVHIVIYSDIMLM
jgi:hypothetical protein